MKVKKTVTKEYEITPFPADGWTISMKEFMQSRKEHGMKTKPFERCFCCGHRFEDDEIPRVAAVSGVGNRFLCHKCAESDE